MSGKFITFEGIEGAGKTTQARALFDFLQKQGYEVCFTREPGGTLLGDKIRGILADISNKDILPETELFLFAASRFQHVRKVILPAIREGKIVICDRFTDATTAYQGYGRGIDLEIIEKVNILATGNLKPDLTIYLDIEPRKGFLRVASRTIKTKNETDRIEKEGIAFFEKVRKGYLELAENDPQRIKVINGLGDIDKVFDDIREAVFSFLKMQKIKPEKGYL